MARFNYEAYDRLYPRVEEPVKAPESAVETFHPTKDKIEGNDPDVVDIVTPEDNLSNLIPDVPEDVPGDPDEDNN